MSESNEKSLKAGDIKSSDAAASPVKLPRRAGHQDDALLERFFRRTFESVGAIVDRRLGRDGEVPANALSLATLTKRLRRAIDDNVKQDSQYGRIAPHLMRLKIEWGTHSDAPREAVTALENEILTATIDYLNDQRLRTLAPVRVETVVDIFTSGISVEPSFGEFEDELKARREGTTTVKKTADTNATPEDATPKNTDITVQVRATIDGDTRETKLVFEPNGRRIHIGRARDNDLYLDHPSVSKIHAAMRMNADGTLILADTGSTNGTFINGRRIAYGEARTLESGDVVGFGETEVRFRKLNV